MEDIQVLGKSDIKSDAAPDASTGDAQDKKTEKDASDLDVEEEVQRLIHEEEKDKKKRLKRVREAKIKLAERLVLKMDHSGDRIEQHDDELFSLSTLHDLVGLEESNRLTGDTGLTGVDELVRREKAASMRALREKREEERRSAIEGAKRVHFERRGAEAEQEFEEDRDVASSVKPLAKHRRSEPKDAQTKLQAPLPRFDAFTLSKLKRNPLLVDLDHSTEETKLKRKIRSWLQSDDIQNILNPIDSQEEDGVDDTDSDSDGFKDPVLKNKQKKKSKLEKPKVAVTEVFGNTTGSAPKTSSGMTNETKTTAETSNSSASKDDTETDTDGKPLHRLRKLRRPLTPVERALAVRLIQSSKSRRDLIESQYHKMQFFEEPSELPDWFVEDEKKHMYKPLPVSKEEVVQDRPTMGRSLSKVEEAKARQKARLAKRLKRIRQKAEGISDDVSEAEKWQKIKQMYKKAGLLTKKRRPLHVIVNTKSGARKQSSKIPKGAKVKIVDRRMKADLRGQQRSRGGRGKGKRGGLHGRPVKLMAHKPRNGGRRH
ncbi:2'-O-ribose RNA methyltransferase SPB1 [Fasciola gigantica]|uniref:2'-O-ribose RNA methyltransferase SPB1 n=1 Tax=Fasciola gigantica TaxID=46835 RepID=A0A504YV63_FASGI|nr:2'-O-ribose RNA methyltransferase SPB1 [Fasciola gigantica]